MKKRVLSMLMVMIMMVSMLSVSVFAATCPDGTCTPSDWISNGTKHWKICVNDGCGAVIADSEGNHDWANDASDDTNHWKECSVCGKADTPVAHSYTTLKYDASNHWNECACGAKDTAEAHVDADGNMACDVCTEGHVCKIEVQFDDDNHWEDCADPSCNVTTVTKEEHKWEKQDSSTATNYVYKCSVCGKEYSEHVCVWETSYTWNDSKHWYKCTDSTCDKITGEGNHYDHNGTGICDAGDCNFKMSSKTISVLHVNGLSAPVEGATVDFSVTVDEPYYGTPSVKWNRVTNLKNNTSVALGTTATYAAGNMYNVSIYVPMDFNDVISESMKVYLDGKEVTYYGTTAAFEGAVQSYEGDNTVYMARHLKISGQRYIIVSVMFPKLEGTHAHSYGADWVETPAKHYHLCSGCGDIKDAEYHYDNNKSGLCDVCGFDMKYYNKNASANSGTGTATGTHTHTYSTDWVEDISNHWKQCTGCGAKTSVAAHADLNNSGKCDLCGFVMTAAAGHTHTFATEWTETFAQHYKVCSCGAKNEIAAHVDLNNTGKCDTCGYAMTTLSNNGIVADTGDNNATFLWMAAFAVSALGAAATVLVARKKREE